ncbi:flagellar hook-length control protein [Corallococcus sp. H22C18031201]|uniref:flagellar hook-length control protein n=1 Tax=Citreicoccus inhibens TaxID=2849499 RepID=UPI000E731FFF|nr:flagellar hook-length control protein [Citreicoccus inhibens]MBU8895331.1 flagellar hook-length control protein [Citreicoccus inhibens]RJS22624.1 flagellar hook-length control protein [Corallococcus sp. H22C18031201]
MNGRCDVRLAVLGISLLAVPTALASGGRGMTWSKLDHVAGVDHVGCASCNAYQGETACTAVLPVLCLKQDGAPVPPGVTPDFYNGWTSANLATTLPVAGTSLTSLSVANQLCASTFGAGWRMAEFHDGGGGWNWYGYGNVRGDLRFWTYINDQRANCWNP